MIAAAFSFSDSAVFAECSQLQWVLLEQNAHRMAATPLKTVLNSSSSRLIRGSRARSVGLAMLSRSWLAMAKRA